jgi:transmembrane sensor
LVNGGDKSDRRSSAEAAAWLARLQCGAREGVTDHAFRAWLRDNEAHRDAFERAADIWEMLPGAMEQESVAAHSEYRARSRFHAPVLAMVCMMLMIVAGGLFLLIDRAKVYEIGRGEQQTIILADGSRVNLNTDSRMEVHYSSGERRIELTRGEALFEVTKDPGRPFIVYSGKSAVRALGTTFAVRHGPDLTAFTLVEGKVEVVRGAKKQEERLALLKPGERLTVRTSGRATMDRPSIDALLSWRDGEVCFDDTTLAQAAGELNRYSKSQRIVVSPGVSAYRISGIFMTRDPSQFINAVVQLHRLRVSTKNGEIILMAASEPAAGKL